MTARLDGEIDGRTIRRDQLQTFPYLCTPKKQTGKRNEYEIYTQTNMGDHFPDPSQFVDGTLD